MPYKTLAAAAALLALCLPMSAALAQDFYVTPALVYTDDDRDRQVDDEFSGGQVALGVFLTENFALEGLLGVSNLKGVDDIELQELGANGLFYFGRKNRIAPYLKVGFGFLKYDSDLLGNDDTAFHTYGAGLNVRLGEKASLQLEYRQRESGESDINPVDTIMSLGLSVPFGKKERPAPVAPRDPDSDGDGVNDSMDDCPNTPAGHRVDARGCSLDSDGDGVVDANDKCPNTFRGAAVDARGCEMDDDKDGVVNRLDECPNTPAGARVDTKGCEIKEVIELPGVNFESNSDRLLPGADSVLRDAAATLRKYPELVVEVAGHTDSDGSAEYNEGLSERRANTVRDYLINAGVDEANLSARGYGEAQPVADNSSAVGKARNRRVELRIISD